MKKRILITGSGGFLGSRLAEYFEGKDGYETVAVTHEELDITDMVAVSAFLRRFVLRQCCTVQACLIRDSVRRIPWLRDGSMFREQKI